MVKSLPSTLLGSFLLLLAFNVSSAEALEFSYGGQKSGFSDLSNSSLCNRYFPIYERRYRMPRNMLRAIAVTESGKWSKAANKAVAWPWTINVEGKGYYFKSRSEAIRNVKNFLAQGKTSIDVGCMQISLKYHPDAFANLNQAFEPRYNIAYAAHFLNQKFTKNDSWETAIRHYHNVNTVHSDQYLARVYENWNVEDETISVAQLEKPSMRIRVTPRHKDESSDVSEITRSAFRTFLQ